MHAGKQKVLIGENVSESLGCETGEVRCARPAPHVPAEALLPNMATVSRSTGRGLSTLAIMSSSTANWWRNGWASSTSPPSLRRLNRPLPAPCQPSLGAPDQRRQPIVDLSQRGPKRSRSGPPMKAYRVGECAIRHLDGYHGILRVGVRPRQPLGAPAARSKRIADERPLRRRSANLFDGPKHRQAA